MEKQLSLLDTVQIMLQCEYLSDLKDYVNRNKLIEALISLDISDFSLADWSDAVFYLFQTAISFKSEEDVRSFITDLV